jgi:hypothetical protein
VVKKKVSTLSKLGLGTKRLLDEWDLRSVTSYLLRMILSSSSSLRAGYIAALGHLVRATLKTLKPTDFEWVLLSIVETLADSPQIRDLSFEEQVCHKIPAVPSSKSQFTQV